jgi:RAB6A-GEF complex partner protein 1
VDEAVVVPPTPSSTYANQQKTFLEGPGEGLQRQAVSLHFEGVVRVDGDVLRSVSALHL